MRHALHLALVAIALIASVGISAGDNTVYMSDPTRQHVVVIDIPTDKTVGFLDVNTHHPSGDIALSTVPSKGDRYAFLLQPPYLRVLDTEGELPSIDFLVRRELGRPGFVLRHVAAAGNILFLAGRDGTQPLVIALDQSSIIDGVAWPGALIAEIPACAPGSACDGEIVNLTALGGSGVGEAIVATFEEQAGVASHGFYRIHSVTSSPTIEAQAREVTNLTSPATVALAPSADGTLALGSFPDARTLVETGSGAPVSCALDGSPTAVAAWHDPTTGGEVIFTTYAHGGWGRLSVFESGGCPTDTGALTVLVGLNPVAVALDGNSASPVEVRIVDLATNTLNAIAVDLALTPFSATQQGTTDMIYAGWPAHCEPVLSGPVAIAIRTRPPGKSVPNELACPKPTVLDPPACLPYDPDPACDDDDDDETLQLSP